MPNLEKKSKFVMTFTINKEPFPMRRKVKDTVHTLSVSSIRRCLDRTKLESKFEERNISKKNRIQLLREAMGNPAIAYSDGLPSIEDRYEIIISSYVAGVWKKDYSSLKARGKLEAL